LEDLAIGGRIILRWIYRKWVGDMDLIDLAQNRDGWWLVIKVLMNHWVT